MITPFQLWMALTVMTVIRVSQETWLADMPKWDGIVAVYTAVTAAIDIIGHSDSHPDALSVTWRDIEELHIIQVPNLLIEGHSMQTHALLHSYTQV